MSIVPSFDVSNMTSDWLREPGSLEISLFVNWFVCTLELMNCS